MQLFPRCRFLNAHSRFFANLGGWDNTYKARSLPHVELHFLLLLLYYDAIILLF